MTNNNNNSASVPVPTAPSTITIGEQSPPALLNMSLDEQAKRAWHALVRARGVVSKVAPYFTTAMHALRPVEAPGMGTIGVTHSGVLYFDPAFILDVMTQENGLKLADGSMTMDPGILAGIMCHEVNHFLRVSARRTSALTGIDMTAETSTATLTDEQRFLLKISNIAADLAINPDVRDMGFKLPTGKHEPVWPKTFEFAEGLQHEEYYRLLLQLDEEQQKDECTQDKDAAGRPNLRKLGGHVGAGACGSGGGHFAAGVNEPGGQTNDGQGQGQGQGHGHGHGHNHGHEAALEAQVGARSDTECEAVRQSVAQAIIEALKAAQSGQGRGRVPGGLAVWANKRLQPSVVPWNQELRTIVTSGVARAAGLSRTTLLRRSKRQAAMGEGVGTPQLPGYYRPSPIVWFLVDSSGSMLGGDLERGAGEINGALRAAQGELWVGSMDTELHPLQRVTRFTSELAAKLLIGGGGTDFTPLFERLKNLGRSELPSVVIMATDGDAWGCPTERPSWLTYTTFVWLMTRPNRQPPVQWGRRVWISKPDRSTDEE